MLILTERGWTPIERFTPTTALRQPRELTTFMLMHTWKLDASGKFRPVQCMLGCSVCGKGEE